MAKLQNTFEFVGNLKFGKEPIKETVFDSGWAKKEVSVAINESKANGVFLNVEGGYHKNNGKMNKVYSFSKGIFGERGNKMEISWDSRKDPSIINSVADFSKTVIDLTTEEEAKKKYYDLRGEIWKLESNDEPTQENREELQSLYEKVKEVVPHRYEFIHGVDVVEFFEEFSDKLNDKKFRVRGNVEISHWKGKFYINYKPISFELVNDDIPNKLSADLDLYFTKDAMDKSLLKSDKVVTFNTHILSYDSSHRKEVFFPLETVLNLNNYDLENNQAHKTHYNLIEKYMTVKGKGVHRLPFAVKIVRGSEIEEFTENDLTEDQKSLVEIGFAKLEDFKPKGGKFGESVNEVRLTFPKIKELGQDLNFTDGAALTDYEEDDLEYVAVERGTKTSDIPKDVVNKDDSNPFDISDDDLPF